MKTYFWWAVAISVFLGLLQDHIKNRRPGISADASWRMELCRTGPTTSECTRQ
jgi:hypothetical protein